MSHRSLSRRVTAATGLAAGSLLLLAGPASAHVTMSPTTAEPGGSGIFSFKVPTERDDASTTQVQVVIPAGAKLAEVAVRPVPGWTVTVTKTKLATPIPADEPGGDPVSEVVSSITYRGGQIKPGQFQSFDISMGPLPDRTGSLAFKTLQTYSDGKVERWIEVPQASQPHPEHPAPLLAVSAAVQPNPAVLVPVVRSGEDGTARALGAGGLLAGIAALALSVLAVRRRRTPAAPGPAAPGPGEPQEQPVSRVPEPAGR